MTLTRIICHAKSTGWFLVWACLLAIVCPLNTAGVFADEPAAISEERIAAAFATASDGYSADEVLITDQLRESFLAALFQDENPSSSAQRDAMLSLLQLRKAGKLKTKATRRGKRVDPSVSAIAEIAARVVCDRHRVSVDTVLADPLLRAELDREAKKIVPAVDSYAVRKSLLQLRKKRALKPELVLRVADWKREIKTYRLPELRRQLAAGNVPAAPGIYLFRNAEGYLYIGEASDLAARLKQHLAQSDRVSLAEYLASDAAETVTVELHQFPKKSPAAKLTVRRAYESELIRSRNPKFNSRP